MKDSFFTKYTPDPTALILKTGYYQFETITKVDGLCIANASRFDLLAVHIPTIHRGKGKFRDFVAQLKKRYVEIYVWHINNPLVESALIRYGFRKTKTKDEDGKWLDVVGFKST